MGKPDAPEMPNPMQTANLGFKTNLGMANINALLGNPGTISPYGTTKMVQTGVQKIRNPITGKMMNQPIYSQKQTMSAPVRRIFNQQMGAQGDMAALAGRGVNQLSNMKQPGVPKLDFNSGEAGNKRVEDALMARMQPGIDRDRAAMEASLANQGLNLGSEAYSSAQGDFSRGVNDARLGAILQSNDEARAQAGFSNAAKTQQYGLSSQDRQNRLGEVLQLMGGGRMPQQSGGAQGSGLPNIDIAGLVNQNYSNQMGQYGQQMQSWNQGMGALGSVAGLLFSDRRLKAEIRKVRGGVLPVYEYRYLWDDPGTVRRGYMAQDVLGVVPAAVRKVGEWLALDYSMLPEVR